MKSAAKTKFLAVVLAIIIAVLGIFPTVSFAKSVTKSTTTTAGKVNCFVSLDNKWTQIDTITTYKKGVFGRERYYVTASELEKVYSSFGFKAAAYNGERFFPHTDTDSYSTKYIWADATAVFDDDTNEYLIPVSFRTESFLYYMPANVSGNSTYFEDSCLKNDQNVIDANTFYKISVNDYSGLIPSGSTPELPNDKYLFKGESTSVTLPLVDEVYYECENPSTSKKIDLPQTTDEQAKTVTVNINNINCSVNIYTKSNTAIGENDAIVNCYVALNDTFTLVKKTVVTKQYQFGNKTRYYITSNELENIYKDYGFKESNYNGELYFPHTDSEDKNNIWADTAPVYNNEQSTYYVPLSHRKEIYLYYLPHNNASYGSYFNTSASILPSSSTTILNVIKDNSFYSVKVRDDINAIPDGTTPALPNDAIYLNGENVDLTLPYFDDLTYKYYNDSTKKSISLDQSVADDKKTITVSIKGINQPILIKTSNGMPNVVYYASVADQLVQIGEFAPSKQTIVTDGTINSQSTLLESVKTSSTATQYLVRDIDSEKAIVTILTTNGNNRHYLYSFEGWKVCNSDKILQPYDKIDINELKGYADDDGEIKLKAIWNILDSNNRASTINFYLNLDCEIMDNLSNGFSHQHQNKFTPSIYATRIYGTDSVDVKGGDLGTQVIAPPTSEDTAYEADSTLRNGVTTPIDPGVTIEDFPTNESILAQLRESNTRFTLDGKTVNSDDLTTDNFTIRWYVLKYEKNDGWHIDGVLVAKTGRLVIKKTFAGDLEAIEKAKSKFNISVTHTDTSNNTSTNDYTLSLNDSANESDSSKTGYTSYDADTDTYTWSLTVRQGREYNIKENNYSVNQDKWNNSVSYKITNSENETQGWKTYVNSGINISAYSYPSDVPDVGIQTVEFRNMYVQAGLLTVSKIDSITENGLKNVKFKISKVDGTPLVLYKKADSNDYSTDSAAQTEGYNELVSDNIVETNSNGFFTVKLAIHGSGTLSEEYYLEETIPTGYEGPKKIKVTVTDMGKVELAQEVVSSSTVEHSDWLDGVGTNHLIIKNKSKLLTSVRVRKDWGDTDTSKIKEVTVELWRNGAKLSDSKYTQKLNSTNNQEYEWSNLPLYIDGNPATYIVREIAIGSTAYDANADSDGYEDYMVTYDTPLYKEGADGTYSDKQTWTSSDGTRHFADHALLVLHNREVNNTIAFAKVDDLNRPLEGVEFTLYSNEDCTDKIESAVSDVSGYVHFSNQISGTYYLKETKSLDDYLPNDTIYKVVVKAGKVTITENGSTSPITKIVNYYTLRNLEFSFIKASENGNPLANAKFGLYRLKCTDASHNHSEELLKVNSDGTLKDDFTDCWELVDVESSAKRTGLVKFENLRGSETYRLVEIDPPHGYKSPKGQWQINYNRNITPQEFTIQAIGQISETPAFEKLTNSAAPYRLANYKSDDLPSSGGNGIAIYEYVGGAFIGFGVVAVIILIIKKKKTK